MCVDTPRAPRYPTPQLHNTGRLCPNRPGRLFLRLMKKAREITPNLEPLFGTRDENLRLMEEALHVRIDFQSDGLVVEGPEESIGRVERIFADFEALRRSGVNLQNGEL